MSEHPHASTTRDHALSPAGRARRDAMLESLLPLVEREAGRRRSRRRMGRAVTAALLICGVGTVSWLALRPAPPQSGHLTITERAPVTPAPEAPAAAIRIVRADPNAVRHLIVQTRVDVASVAIEDDELIDTLAAIGRPTGLIRTPDRAWLTAQVTDAERSRDEEDRSPLFEETGA